MMGSGKSTIGNIISKKIDFEFIDTDYEIEKYEKISIKKIFDNKGEDYFRKLEETIILKSINLDNKVISLGVNFENGLANPEINKGSGDVVYLDNRPIITRNSRQKEDIKIILEF